jgi:hypothetical protein
MQSVMVSASFGLLALLFPPLSYLSGAAVALVTLRHGAREGLIVLVGASVAAALLGLVVVGGILPALLLALVLWLPLWVLALILRYSASLVLTVQVAALLGVLWVLIIYAMFRDPVEGWFDLLEPLKPALQQMDLGRSAADLDQQLQALAQLMTGMLAAVLVLSLMLNLFLARWWQSLLFHPGGFREEFHGLRLGRVLSALTLILFAVARLGDGTLAHMAQDMVWVATAVFLLSGLALVHRVVAHLKAHVGWLIAIYVLLFVDPMHVLPILALVGLVDSWLNLRFPKGSAS